MWRQRGDANDETKVKFDGEFPLDAALTPSFEFLKPSVQVIPSHPLRIAYLIVSPLSTMSYFFNPLYLA